MRSLFAHARPLFVLGALLFVACSGGESRLVDPKPADPGLRGPYIVLLSTRLDTLAFGESRVYTARVTDAAGVVQMVPVDWTSTDPSVLTVNAGAATAIGFGTAGLVARYGTAADTATVIVPDDGSSLQLSPSAVAASLGDTLEFQARLVTSSGSSTRMQRVLWTVSDSSAAQVLGDGRIVTVNDGDLDVIAAVAGKTAVASVNVARSTVASITISPPAASINVGGSVDLNAIVLDLKGHVMRGAPVSWTVSDPMVASVDNAGKVQGIGGGGVMVTARSGVKSATATVNVAPQPAATVTLALDPDTVVVGSQLQAAAVPRDANGQPASGRPIAYQSSNPAVATITNTGLITPATAGVTNVSAICDGLVATVKLTVQNQQVVSVTIVPAAPVVMQGTTAALAVSVLDQMGASVPGALVTWSSQTPTIATVSSSGVLTGVALGSSQISATAGGVTGTAIATVNSQPVASVQVAPSALSVQAGQSATLSATALMASGQTMSGASFTWSSSNSTIATVSALGVVSANAAGSVTITATSGGKSSSASVTVSAPPPVPVASISVTLNSPTMLVGQSTQAIARLYDAQGNILTGRTVTWSSANSTLATVSSSGAIAALAAGTVSISASSGGQTGLTSVTVAAPAPAPVASVSVSAPANVLPIGQTSQMTVTLRDAQSNVLFGRTILYTSSNTSIAAVSASGLVTAKAGGTATITVTSEAASGTIAYTVSASPPTLTQITLTPAAVTLSPGGGAQFAVAGLWSDGSATVPTVTYSATGGTITADGLYNAGTSSGAFQVIATHQGGTKADTSTVIISAPAVTLLQLLLSPASITLAPGGTSQFSVSGTWSDSSSTVPVATYTATGGAITPLGLYTAGTTPGTFRVIATQQGGTKADTSAVTISVPPPTLTQLVLTPGSVTLAPGGSGQFAVSGTWSDGSTTVPAVTYSATGGSITAGGLYTAGTSSGIYRVIGVQTGGTRADTSVVTIAAAPPQCIGSSTVICPGESIQAKVDAAGAGTAFTIKAGVHRLQSVAPKSGNTFTGEPGAILSGAKVLTGWVQDGSRWYVTAQTQQRAPNGNNSVVCEVVGSRCDNPEDLWIDNVLKTHVTSLAAVSSGKWFFDYLADRIYVGDNPAGRTVETSVTEYAFSSSASNVTIQGIIVEKYANREQTGAIGGPTPGSGWVARNNEVRSNHGIGIQGSGAMLVAGNNVHHNGQLGIGGQFARADSNEIAYNNTVGYNARWEAGGTKFAFTNGLVARGNFVHHNHGNGLWTDISNINTLYENNRSEDNDLSGIFEEISYGAVIRNNIVRRNGASQPANYAEGMGILVSASRDVEVYGNTVEDNWGGGIFGINPSRGSGSLGLYELKNLWVHDNTVRITRQWVAGIGMENGTAGVAVFSSSYNNRWDRNTYQVPTTITKPFYWNQPPQTWAQWRALGLDVNGNMIP